ncbi:MAG: DUF1634 domain-containing protein [Planctomycetes bacterium]|nr:DUF1634 domain-containing protein [Planctomycetota bacterium]
MTPPTDGSADPQSRQVADEIAYLRSRQLQPVFRVMQNVLLWVLTIVSIALICTGQGMAWARGMSHADIRAAVASWSTPADYLHAVGSVNPAAMMMLGILCGIAMPFLRTMVVACGFLQQRNWLHVALSLLVIAIMLLGLWVK